MRKTNIFWLCAYIEQDESITRNEYSLNVQIWKALKVVQKIVLKKDKVSNVQSSFILKNLKKIHKKQLMVEISIIEIRHVQEENPYSF